MYILCVLSPRQLAFCKTALKECTLVFYDLYILCAKLCKTPVGGEGQSKECTHLRARGANAVPQASFWPNDSGIAARSRPSRRRFDRLRTHSGSALGVTLA